jgi:hypothetical protein
VKKPSIDPRIAKAREAAEAGHVEFERAFQRLARAFRKCEKARKKIRRSLATVRRLTTETTRKEVPA